jgi:hypothetical protein
MKKQTIRTDVLEVDVAVRSLRELSGRHLLEEQLRSLPECFHKLDVAIENARTAGRHFKYIYSQCQQHNGFEFTLFEEGRRVNATIVRCAICGVAGTDESPGWIRATADLQDVVSGKVVVHVAEHLCPRHADEAKKAANLEDQDGHGNGTGHVGTQEEQGSDPRADRGE